MVTSLHPSQQQVRRSQMDLKRRKICELGVEVPLLPLLLGTICCTLLSRPSTQSDFKRKYIENDRKSMDRSLRGKLVGGYRSSPSSRIKRSKKNKVVEWISMIYKRNRWLFVINRRKFTFSKMWGIS
jgi:hypothetical protein